MSETQPNVTKPTEATAKPKLTISEAAQILVAQIRPFFVPRQVIELRALESQTGSNRPHVDSGFYDTEHLLELAKAALQLTAKAKGVYFTINPLKPDLISRRANRWDWAKQGELANDQNVAGRQWLLIDIDPVRDSLISASDSEKEYARQLTEQVETFLRELGWPDPILADSGNGFHLYFRIDLPAGDGGLVERILKKLARQFDTPEAKIDQTVFNPARISKLPGTLARKGDNTPVRPHRRAKILRLPGEPTSALDLPVVSRELLEQLGGPAIPTTKPISSQDSKTHQANLSSSSSRLKIPEWLTDLGIGFRIKDGVDGLGRTTYVLTSCPFDSSHADPDACIMQDAEGKLSAKCFHNGCVGQGWQQFKKALGLPQAHHYDPPLSSRHRGSPRSIDNPIKNRQKIVDSPPPPQDRHDASSADADLPPIIGNLRQLPAVTEDALNAVIQANQPPRLFQRGTLLIRLRLGEPQDPPFLEPLTDAAIRGVLARAAKWFHRRETKEATLYEESPPPMEVVRDFATLPEWRDLPILDGVIESPIYSTPGELLMEPGYHPPARRWYADTGNLGSIPLRTPVSAGDVEWARSMLLDELLGDFPFANEASRAHALAAILLPFVRPLIDRPTPLHFFDAPTEGTGKTLLTAVVGLISCGRDPAPISEADNDEEWRKRITALMIQGPSVILLDNINRLLDSGALGIALTKMARRVFERFQVERAGEDNRGCRQYRLQRRDVPKDRSETHADN